MRDDTAIPYWPEDELDSEYRSRPEPPRFAPDLNAWVVSRYRDVAAVLQHPASCPANIKSDEPLQAAAEDLRARMRAETLAALSPAQLRDWQQAVAPKLERCLRALPQHEPVDVLSAYAKPVCLALAAAVTGIALTTAEALSDKASLVCEQAADPYNPTLQPAAKAAEAELVGHFHSPLMMFRDSSFVAMSQTMPCILGNAWYALAQHPEQWHLLHQQPELTERAAEELLRYAGLVRLLARESGEDLPLGDTTIPAGERILLRVTAANRDAEKYSNATQLDVTRRGGNLALGFGAHSCTGAGLIRMAMVMMTRPLVERFSAAALSRPVEWKGGAVFRSPRELWLSLAD